MMLTCARLTGVYHDPWLLVGATTRQMTFNVDPMVHDTSVLSLQALIATVMTVSAIVLIYDSGEAWLPFVADADV
jgi:hypothetical protein